MKLYYFALSGHSHRARLFLSLLHQPVEVVDVDFMNGEHKSPDYLQLNRFGQVPVLDDDGVIISDSNAILVYLAKKLGGTDWLPEDPRGAASVQRWLSVASGEIACGPAAARLATLFKVPLDHQDAIEHSHSILKLIEAELEGRKWIASDRPTIADVSLYSYISSAPEGDVDLADYSNVNAWLQRIEALPGFFAFPQSSVGLRATK